MNKIISSHNDIFFLFINKFENLIIILKSINVVKYKYFLCVYLA